MKYDVDFERVAMLLSIPPAVAGVAPGMTYLSSAAMSELKEINDELAKEIKADLEAKEAEAAERMQATTAPQRKLSPGEPMPGPAHKVVVAGPDGEPVENEVDEEGEAHTVAQIEKEEGVDLSGDGLVGTAHESPVTTAVVDEKPLKRKL